MADSLQPHGLQHSRLLCPSLSPWACSNSRPLSRWCHPTISSSGLNSDQKGRPSRWSRILIISMFIGLYSVQWVLNYSIASKPVREGKGKEKGWKHITVHTHTHTHTLSYPYVGSLHLCLYFCFANKTIYTIFLDSAYKQSYTIFAFLSLTYFTLYDSL